MATELTCPKCHSAMRSYERNGITIDQCTECRGIFLDRGELERLIDAEAAYNPADASRAAQAPIPAGPPVVRHRAKLVAIRSGCKCEVHAVLAKCVTGLARVHRHETQARPDHPSWS